MEHEAARHDERQLNISLMTRKKKGGRHDRRDHPDLRNAHFS